MKCPHCNKREFVPEVVYIHAESYGGGVSHFRCTRCNKVVSATAQVKVVLENIKKSTKTEGDWG